MVVHSTVNANTADRVSSASYQLLHDAVGLMFNDYW